MFDDEPYITPFCSLVYCRVKETTATRFEVPRVLLQCFRSSGMLSGDLRFEGSSSASPPPPPIGSVSRFAPDAPQP
jgi:hypothetical protein